MSEIGEEQFVDILAAVIPPPLAFFEVDEEFIPSDPVEFAHPHFSEAPEAFNAIDVVLAARKFVAVMMNSVMLITAGDQAIVGFPSIGVDVAILQYSPL